MLHLVFYDLFSNCFSWMHSIYSSCGDLFCTLFFIEFEGKLVLYKFSNRIEVNISTDFIYFIN